MHKVWCGFIPVSDKVKCPHSEKVLNRSINQIMNFGGKSNMSLIRCPECSKEFSDLALSCPHCGYKNKSELQSEESIHNSELREKQATRKFGKKSLFISICAVLLVIIGLTVYFYFQANPPLNKSEKEIFNTAEEAYKNDEYLLAYSLYAQLPDYQKAIKRMDSIEMPLDGTWKCNLGITLLGTPFYFNYYFGEGDIYCAVAGDSTPIISKTAFQNQKIPSQFTFESLSSKPDGTILLAYKNSEGKIANFEINVKSNDRFIMHPTGADPDVFDYSRTS